MNLSTATVTTHSLELTAPEVAELREAVRQVLVVVRTHTPEADQLDNVGGLAGLDQACGRLERFADVLAGQ